MDKDDNDIEALINVDGDSAPEESEEEKKIRIEAEKAVLDKQLANGEIDGVEYNKKVVALKVPEENKPKPHKKTTRPTTVIIAVIVLLLSAFPAAIYLNWRFYFQNSLTAIGVPDYSNDTVSSINADPIQLDLEGYAENGTYKGREINVIYKAYYDITGVVTSVRDYWGFGAYDALVPRDVCMAWGSTATSYSNHGIGFSQGERNCRPEIDGVVIDDLDVTTKRGKWGNQMYAFHDFSNNHIIASTADVRNQVLGLGTGDEVRLTGYLVTVYYDGIILSSSMSREDSGDHACEVFYVTRVEK